MVAFGKILILFLLISNSAFSEDLMSVGFFAGDAVDSDERRVSNNKPTATQGVGGAFFAGGMVDLFLGLYLYGDLRLEIRGIQTEYQFLDPETLTVHTSTNLKTRTVTLGAHVGLRFRFLSIFFVGGGMDGGRMTLAYNSEDYKSKNSGSDQGLESSETAGVWGPYGEAGLMFVTSNFGLSISARLAKLKTGKYETLDNDRLTYEKTDYIISFMAPIPDVF